MRTIKQNTKIKALSAIAAAATLLAFSSSYSAVIVTAGTLEGIGGSTVSQHPTANPLAIVANYGASQNDNSIHLLLDLGSAQDVSILNIINRRDVGTDMSVRTLSVLVARDEQSPSFDPLSLSSYTISVLPNYLLEPSTGNPGVVRPVDVEDFNRRYVLINVNSNFVSGSEGISHSGNRAQVQIGDITVIPEPHTVGMLTMGGAIALGALLRKKSVRFHL